jgi:serine/threonine-protein kinase
VVTVPDVSGGDYDAAAAALTQIGLNPVRVDQPSSDVPAGDVIGTDPPAGTVVVEGFTVDVLVSTGPPSPTPPIDASPTTARPA